MTIRWWQFPFEYSWYAYLEYSSYLPRTRQFPFQRYIYVCIFLLGIYDSWGTRLLNTHISREWIILGVRRWQFPNWIYLEYMSAGWPDYSYFPRVNDTWGKKVAIPILNILGIYVSWGPPLLISPEWMILEVRRWQFPYWIYLEYMSVGGPDYSYLLSEWYLG